MIQAYNVVEKDREKKEFTGLEHELCMQDLGSIFITA